MDRTYDGSEIAVIGMSCRFPGARNIDEFWALLRDGVEAISFLKDDELEPSIVDPVDSSDPNYVKAASVLDDVDMFDAAFFGFTPKEAEVMDPQHRLFLECSWEALEQAGYNAETYKGAVGVFAGARTNTYLFNLFYNQDAAASLGAFEIGLGNDLAFLPTRVSYKLNLRGPSYAIHTACSTSLVAVHLACQSLLIDECQMALAGGVAVNIPQKTGYLYTRGGITSPDGHCRPFDAKAQGTLFGSGSGVVVLKRLEDALADGDSIYAVIRGTAANNDGSSKASFTAPSVHGQSNVISEALASAGVDPNSITYVETHGTGTALGDPIEIKGLTKAFHSGEAKRFCGIGSVKSNLGHLDAAAGIASFIKTTLALHHKMLPPSLHFQEPNPNIDFGDGPFYVNAQLRDWETDKLPRRAGVSAFGVGGTNAHVIVEEAPHLASSPSRRRFHLLPISARSSSALESATSNLALHLRNNSHLDLADVAFTLQAGRKHFPLRRFAVSTTTTSAASALASLDPGYVFDSPQEAFDRPVAFLFPGGGAQFVHMGEELYSCLPAFRAHVDDCLGLLRPMLGLDLTEVMFAPEGRQQEAEALMRGPALGLPALFVIEYALARMWMEWGVRPEAMIGHSLGEYVAACVSGVFSLEDALKVVVARGRLFEKLPKGAMAGVTMSEQRAREYEGEEVSIAAVNGPEQVVMSGSEAAIQELMKRLEVKGVESRRIQIEVAAHSYMVEEIVEEFYEEVRGIRVGEVGVRFISNVSGGWITQEEAGSGRYWVEQLRGRVRFKEGIEEVMREGEMVLLEVGPGQVMSNLVRMQEGYRRGREVVSTMRGVQEKGSEEEQVMRSLGRMWSAGVGVEWEKVWGEEEGRRRVRLPSYPFERQRYWVGPGERRDFQPGHQTASGKSKDVADWFYVPSWKRTPLLSLGKDEGGEKKRLLILGSGTDLERALLARFKRDQHEVITARIGEQYGKLEEGQYAVNHRGPEDYHKLVTELVDSGWMPTDILHLWSMTYGARPLYEMESFNNAQEAGFYSLLYLAQALEKKNCSEMINLWLITNDSQEVESGDVSSPEKATMLGPCKIIPQEFPNIASHYIDIVVPEGGSREESYLADQLIAEISAKPSDPVAAYRGKRRWVQTFEQVRLDNNLKPIRSLRDGGVYLISGGLGGVGLLLAQYLARTVRARLILVGRTPLPDRAEWEGWLTDHDPDNAVTRRIEKIKEIEQMGVEVLVATADVANEEQMRSVIAAAYEKYGELNGVIHAAGVTSGSSVFNRIADIGFAEAQLQFGPKAAGLYVLEKLLRDKEVDFCMMTSSNSSVLGGMGLVAYSAANAFMDAFAVSARKTHHTAWISASWDPWPEDTKKYTGVQTSMDKYTMTEDESLDAFTRVVTMIPEEHVVVATGDFPARYALWIKRDYSAGSDAGAAAHRKAMAQSAYVAPSNETERLVAEIWQQILGIEQVGARDNFFDLGGHSLLATRLVARLRSAFEIDLPLQKFFEAPTVTGLAKELESLRSEKEDAETEDLINMMAQLSDEEVRMELSKRKSSLENQTGGRALPT